MTSALACVGLDAGYTEGRPVVHKVDLAVDKGDVLALLGPNGAGKTTLLSTFAGLLPQLAGDIDVAGVRLRPGHPRAASRAGVVLVPDDRALFTGLSVRDNLSLARRKGGTTVDAVLDFFPALRDRVKLAAGMLSGGEQQMLAIGRALMQDPTVLLIDELSMGLAPVIVEALLPVVRQVATETGAAVILVEQHVRLALGIADRAVVIAHGTKVLEGTGAGLLADQSALERAYLGEKLPSNTAA